MAQTIPQQLAAHIDSICSLNVSQFFDANGNILACQYGEDVFSFTIACSLAQYEEDEHGDYLTNVHNMIQGDVDSLIDVQNAVENFTLPGDMLL